MAIDPRTLPDYIPGGFYDDNGNLLAYYGPYGGAPSGGPGVGYSAVGPPNSGGGAGYVGSGYGYTPAGPPVSPLGGRGFGGAGAGIYADASAYLGGDFQGGGSDPYAGTDFAGGGGGNQPLYSGGGIGSDPSAHSHIEYGYDGSPTTVYDSGIPPDTMGGQGYGFAPYPMGGGGGDGGNPPWMQFPQMTPPQGPAAPPSSGGGWEGAGWNPWFNSPGSQYSPPQQAAPSYGDYSSARDFMGGGGVFTGVGADGTPMFSMPDTMGGQGFNRDSIVQAMMYPGDIGSFPGRGPSPGYTPGTFGGGGGPTWQGQPLQPYYNQPYNQAYPIGGGGQMSDFPSMQWPPGLAGENIFVGSPGTENIFQPGQYTHPGGG